MVFLLEAHRHQEKERVVHLDPEMDHLDRKVAQIHHQAVPYPVRCPRP
jgi:hypothetical protein